MWTSRLCTCVLVLLLVGCSSIPKEKVDQRIRAWQGIHINQLIDYWGLPTKKQEINGKHYAEWQNRSSEPGNTSLSIGTGTRSGHTGIGIGVNLFDLGGTDDQCSRLVEYNDQGKVTQIQWNGTGDFCYELTPDRAKVTQRPVMNGQ